MLTLGERASPSSPASGYVSAYAKADGLLYTKDDSGVERLLTNGWQLLSTATAAASAALDFTALTGYYAYAFILTNLVPATDSTALWMRVSKDNLTWHAGVDDYGYALTFNLVGLGNGSVNDGSDNQIVLASDTDAGVTTQGHSGFVIGTGFSSSTQVKHFTHITMGVNSTPAYFSNHGGSSAHLATSGLAAITGVRFMFSSGNIASGTVKCYGIV